MDLNLDTDIVWDDPHAHILNRLYTLYQVDLSGLGNLSDIGYNGFADPLFENEDDGPYTPDFLAIGPDGDAQIIDVKGFENIEEYLAGQSDVEEKIQSVVEELEKYEDISQSMVSDYLTLHDISYEPNEHELVVLLPHEIYEKYESRVVDAAESVGLKVWVLEENSVEHLWMASGNHNNDSLHDYLQRSSGRGVRVYEGGRDYIRFVRDTNKDVVRFYFVAHITAHCAHEGKLKFAFDEIDDILVRELRPPMFGHLPTSERDEIWIDCIRTMRDRFDLISRLPTIDDKYEWERTRFLRQPRDRYKILQEVGGHLGVLEDHQ